MKTQNSKVKENVKAALESLNSNKSLSLKSKDVVRMASDSMPRYKIYDYVQSFCSTRPVSYKSGIAFWPSESVYFKKAFVTIDDTLIPFVDEIDDELLRVEGWMIARKDDNGKVIITAATSDDVKAIVKHK